MATAWRLDWQQASPEYAQISPPEHPTYDLYKVIDAALEEDAGDLGDVTTLSTIPADRQATATFIAKAAGVLAGTYVAQVVFKRVDSNVVLEWKARDGDTVQPKQVLGIATGSARSILIAERIALNFMQRMSGIATLTSAMVKVVEGSGSTILDTRKTVPGLRLLDKWAVKIGGGANHRMGLYDMFMIKDNHIAAAGGIEQAVVAAEKFMAEKGIERPLEVETRNIEELQQILDIVANNPKSKITRIMLDNMTSKDPNAQRGINVSLLHQAMSLIKQSTGESGRRIETEASGNVLLETVGVISQTGVQFISCGALTHSVTAMDISLLIET